MALYICNQAEEILLDLILAGNTQLKLHQNDPTAGLTSTQINALTEANFTEATFVGYSAKTLTGGSWVTTQDNPSTGAYAQQTFTRTSTGAAQLIYGYHIVRSSDSKLLWHERFTGPVSTSTNGDTIKITPTITLEDDQEATVTSRGVIAYQKQTAASSGYTADGTSDFALANVDVDATRLYSVHLSTPYNLTNLARWLLQVYADGVNVDRIGDVSNLVASSLDGFIEGSFLWEPDTGQVDLDVRLDEISGTATLSFPALTTATRIFWVEDVGPR